MHVLKCKNLKFLLSSKVYGFNALFVISLLNNAYLTDISISIGDLDFLAVVVLHLAKCCFTIIPKINFHKWNNIS